MIELIQLETPVILSEAGKIALSNKRRALNCAAVLLAAYLIYKIGVYVEKRRSERAEKEKADKSAPFIST